MLFARDHKSSNTTAYIILGWCILGVDNSICTLQVDSWTDLLEQVCNHVNILVLHKVVVYVGGGVTATTEGWGGIGLRMYVSPCFIAFLRCV